jgi:hypothetical protein
MSDPSQTVPAGTDDMCAQLAELWATAPPTSTRDLTACAAEMLANGTSLLHATEMRLADHLDVAVIGARGPSVDLVRAKRKAETLGLPWPPKAADGDGPIELRIAVEYLDPPPSTVPPVWRGVQRGSLTGLAGFIDLRAGS